MGTREQIRTAMHRQPFLGFTIKLTDGPMYVVKHPDFISIPPTERGRDVVIHDNEGMHLIDMLHIIQIEVPLAEEAPTSSG